MTNRTVDLRAHRRALAENPLAFEVDLPRAKKTVVKHLRDCGYLLLKLDRANSATDAYVEALFEAQDRQAFFHVEAPLPYCWNRPNDWAHPHIRYEWGHLRSKNQNSDADELTNLCLMSARCNQHIVAALDIEEVRHWLAGSAVAARIDQVLAARAKLFESNAWQTILSALAQYRAPPKIDFF